MSRLPGVLTAVLTVLRTADDHDVKYPAAAMAYYAFVSFLPLAVLVLAVLGESLASDLQSTTPRFLTPEAQALVYEGLTAASGRAGAAVFAVVVIAWGGANVVLGFQTAVERVEEREGDPFRHQLRAAASILGSLAIAIVLIALTSVTFALLPTGSPFAFVGHAVLLLALTVAFLPMYTVPSREVTRFVEAVPGAFIGALGWTILLTVAQVYAANAASYAIYGVLSGIILILTSLYLGAISLMLGLVVNAIRADGTEISR
ncbi:membrane protein [Halomicrobium zhouii]|uniref:Membrane protein n=1 Tax=Halomicrobium zhouii TaxID=767519 RepID=A0A1I6KED4_9EURY|nr:YihY/virulence factor BrkB family protein [Halomicrobium zhouii]SFR89566.1 membrane protein [Halomicrobium zhouii]